MAATAVTGFGLSSEQAADAGTDNADDEFAALADTTEGRLCIEVLKALKRGHDNAAMAAAQDLVGHIARTYGVSASSV